MCSALLWKFVSTRKRVTSCSQHKVFDAKTPEDARDQRAIQNVRNVSLQEIDPIDVDSNQINSTELPHSNQVMITGRLGMASWKQRVTRHNKTSITWDFGRLRKTVKESEVRTYTSGSVAILWYLCDSLVESAAVSKPNQNTVKACEGIVRQESLDFFVILLCPVTLPSFVISS